MSALLHRSAPLRAALGGVARERRERCGLRQAAVAQRAGISVEQLHAIEEGLANPSILVYARVARLGLASDLASLLLAAEEIVAAERGRGRRSRTRDL